MPSYSLLTTTGKNKEAAALANGTALSIAEIAFGDGDYAPTGGETALLNEIGRKPIHAQGLVDGAPSNAYFDILLDENDGPFTIREAGLFDPDGDMIAIAKFDPVINKPIPSSGQSLSATLKFIVAFSDLENLILRLETSTAFVSALRQINTGDGLKGGGDLTEDRTLSLDIDGLSAITGADVNPTDDRFVILDKSASKPKKLSPADVAVAIGLQDAIDASAIANLGELEDVDDTAPADNQALMWLTDAWKPTTIQISHIASLTSALSGKSAIGHGHVTTEISDFGAAVDARIQAIVDAAPANLDTLNEIAAALGDDANFAATMTANLAGKANVSHTHSWSGITGKPSTFAPSAHSHAWGEITGKPSTFAPAAHSHAWGEITGKPTTFAPASHSHSWSQTTGKPSTFAPSAHSHAISDITGLQSALNAKAEIYTGSSSGNTNYPVGTVILVFGNSGVLLNGATAVKQSGGSTFYFSTGTTLSGTWRNRGYTIGNGAYGTLMQRTA